MTTLHFEKISMLTLAEQMRGYSNSAKIWDTQKAFEKHLWGTDFPQRYEANSTCVRHYHFFVGDCALTSEDGSVTIIKSNPDVQAVLRNLTPSQVRNGSIIAPELKAATDCVLPCTVAQNLAANPLAHPFIRNYIWQYLAGSQAALDEELERCAKLIQKNIRTSQPYTIDNALGFEPSLTPGLRPLFFYSLRTAPMRAAARPVHPDLCGAAHITEYS